jgi:nicotinamidase-related amidase
MGKAQPHTEGPHGLLTPDNCTLLLIDHQPQMGFGVRSIDRQTLVNNVTGLAKAAKVFKVPTILTTIAAKSFSGEIWEQIQAVFPNEEPIDRSSMNAWEDERVVAAVNRIGRRKLVMAGLWTEVCIAFPAISALADGFEVYVVADACGDVSEQAHDMAMRRVIQAGATPVTWMQTMLEWQRDWARTRTYDAVMKIIVAHGGAYGLGVQYAHQVIRPSADTGATKKKAA